MNTEQIRGTLKTLFSELVDGAPREGAYVLNPGDPGLLGALDRLSAAEASMGVAGGASPAAHADHLRYGVSLLNRWAAGEEPFGDADWSASWRRMRVTEDEWRSVRQELAAETHRWLDTLGTTREVNEVELDGMVASIAHLAYHLGAIRQLAPAARGPRQGA